MLVSICSEATRLVHQVIELCTFSYEWEVSWQHPQELALNSGGSFLHRWLHSSQDPSCASGKGTESAWSSSGQSSWQALRWCCPSPPLPFHRSQQVRSHSLDPQLPPHGRGSHQGTADLWTCSSVRSGAGIRHCHGKSVDPRKLCHQWKSWIQWYHSPTVPPRASRRWCCPLLHWVSGRGQNHSRIVF